MLPLMLTVLVVEVHIFKNCSKTPEIQGHIKTWWNDFSASTNSLEDLLRVNSTVKVGSRSLDTLEHSYGLYGNIGTT